MFKKDNGFFYGFLLLLVWAPLPLGSNRTWSSMLLFILAALLLLAWLLGLYFERYNRPRIGRSACYALLLLVLVAVFPLLQLIPLPNVMLGFIPVSAKAYQAVAQPATISVSQSATLLAFYQGLSYCLAFTLTLVLVNSRQRVQVLAMVLVGSATAQAVYGVFMTLSGLNYLFLLEKEFMQTVATGTFVNRNHLAGYLNIGLAMGVGLLLAQLAASGKLTTWRAKLRAVIQLLLSKKVQLRLLLAIMVIGLVMTRSRMGNIAFITALLSTGLIYAWYQKKISIKVVLFFTSILLVDALILGQWFGFEQLKQRIEHTEIEKEIRVDLNRSAIPLAKDFIWLGAGANSYPKIFPMYMYEQAGVPFEHAHNDYLEFLATLGLPVCLLLLMFVVVVLKQNIQLKKPDYAVFMLLIYIAVHSTVDFNLYIPAFAFTLCACLALPFCRASFAQKKRVRKKSRPFRG